VAGSGNLQSLEAVQLRQEIMGGVIHKATNGHNRRHIGEEMEGDMRRSCTKRIASIYFRQARISKNPGHPGVGT